jgi:iron complex transport system substrate-binding protein
LLRLTNTALASFIPGTVLHKLPQGRYLSRFCGTPIRKAAEWRSTAILFAITVFLSLSCREHGKKPEASAAPKNYSRIISLAPSITETLFALSFGDRVVGVSSFCRYPREVEKLPKVGGYTDPNYEMVLRLRPDLVILLKEHTQMLGFLEKTGIDYLLVDDHDFSSIIESFHRIADKCGKSEKADSLASLILAEIAPDTALDDASPTVFICVDRENIGSGNVVQAYSAGVTTFYHDLLKLSGMKNSVSGIKIAYPQVSAEGIIHLQPEIIVDIAMRPGVSGKNRCKDDWQSLSMVPAVKNNMVFCLTGDYVTIPGPRILSTLKEFKRIREVYRQNHSVNERGFHLAPPGK